MVVQNFEDPPPGCKGAGSWDGISCHGDGQSYGEGEVEGAMGSLAIVTAGLLTVIGASFFAQFL